MKKSINKAESLLLMGSMRIAICEAIDNLNVKSKKAMKNFVIKEATDYDIMHFALTESFPRGKASTKDVKVLFEAFSQICLENYVTVAKMVGKRDAMVLINEVSAFDAIRPGTYLSEKAPVNQYMADMNKEKYGFSTSDGSGGRDISPKEMGQNKTTADLIRDTKEATGHDKSNVEMMKNRAGIARDHPHHAARPARHL